MLDKLDAMMGLAPGTLKANFDEATNELTFSFSFDDNLGLGTPVVIASAPVATVVSVQNGNSTSGSEAAEIQLIVVNATGGNFTIGLGDQHSGFFSATANAAAGIQSAIEAFKVGGSTIFSGKVTVAKHGNVYSVLFNLSVGDVGLLSVDSSNLSGTLADQTVIVPGGTSRFWLAYPNVGGTLDLTDALSAGSDVAAALNGLGAISSATVSKADLSTLASSLVGTSKLPTIFKVNNPGGTKELVGLGGFAVDFGASVGDLASVKTTARSSARAALDPRRLRIDLDRRRCCRSRPPRSRTGRRRRSRRRRRRLGRRCHDHAAGRRHESRDPAAHRARAAGSSR